MKKRGIDYASIAFWLVLMFAVIMAGILTFNEMLRQIKNINPENWTTMDSQAPTIFPITTAVIMIVIFIGAGVHWAYDEAVTKKRRKKRAD